MCVILPEAKHGVASRSGVSEQRMRTQRLAMQCCNIRDLDGDQQLELVNRKGAEVTCVIDTQEKASISRALLKMPAASHQS